MFDGWYAKQRNLGLPFLKEYCVAIKSAEGLIVDVSVERKHKVEALGKYYGRGFRRHEIRLMDHNTRNIFVKYVWYVLLEPDSLHIFNLFFHGNKGCFSKSEKKAMGIVSENFFFKNDKRSY